DGWQDASVYALEALKPGQSIAGAALIESATTSVLLRSGDHATVNALGWLDITVPVNNP
ncbi:MAG: hypothetical protein AAF493_17070, partial [Pseudomonadota bacterium]